MIVDALVLASTNAAAFWTVLAETRGYRLTRSTVRAGSGGR